MPAVKMQGARGPSTGGRPHAYEDPGLTALAGRRVVAVILEHYGRIALFKRSQSVGHDRGLWQCITGNIDPGFSPQQQALRELHEETGLGAADLSVFAQCAPIVIPDDGGDPWLVHVFRVVTTRRRLRLNDEHNAYRWTQPGKVARFSNRVRWLDLVLDAAGPELGRGPLSHAWHRTPPSARQGRGRLGSGLRVPG